MAKAKQQPQKTLYHAYFCGDNLGEADGFFTITDGKLELVDCWSLNDAHWRGEYMTGLLTWAGVEVKDLPEKRLYEAEEMLEKHWGLDYSDSGDEHEREDAELNFREGTSDKVYILSLYESGESDDGNSWLVEANYGRRGADLRVEIKGDGMAHDEAKALYDKTLKQKLKKGYKIT